MVAEDAVAGLEGGVGRGGDDDAGEFEAESEWRADERLVVLV